jgi:hypothetical protein
MGMPGEDGQGLARLYAGRARLAERVAPRWWYLAGIAVVTAAFCAVPFVAHYLQWSVGLVFCAFLGVSYLLSWGMARVSGLAVWRKTLRYPSARAAGISWVVLELAGFLAEGRLLDHGLAWIALAVGIVAVLVGMPLWWAQLRGIRRDLAAGAGGAAL